MPGAQVSIEVAQFGVILVEKGEVVVVKPRPKPDLTKHFDQVEVDLDPKDFADYSGLKRTLLGRRRE
jgi:hypothetical protein